MFFAKKLLFFQNQFPKLFTTSGYAILPPGTYQIVVRGSGGSGGSTGQTVDASSPGGSGGAGGKGEIAATTVTLTDTLQAYINIGAAGVVKSQGGNGGSSVANNSGAVGGAGGGGGHACWITIPEISFMFAAQGGGGGGGGAGGGSYGRYADGGASGAGGGFYIYNYTNPIQPNTVPNEVNYVGRDSVPHRNNTSGAAGTQGYNINSSPAFSGAGTRGSYSPWGGGAGAAYYGASGGSGADGDNESGAWSGGGGGGAGGTLDAGGGQGGTARQGFVGGNGYNFHTVPTSTVSENASYGVSGSYGQGGNPDGNGVAGFVLIKRIA